MKDLNNENLITETVKTVNNNTIPKFALGMSLLGGIDNISFWGLMHTDLLQKNLAVNWANLGINLQNNFLLQEQLSQFFTVNENVKEAISQLYEINSQLGQLNKIISKKIAREERENFARELAYNLNKIDLKLNRENDKSYVEFQAKSLLSLIKANKITTATFTEIPDKEYFEDVVSRLNKKTGIITSDEKENLVGFIDVYTYALSLFKDLENFFKQKHFFKSYFNVPDGFSMPEKPKVPEILECEEDIKFESDSIYELSTFSAHLRKYINSSEELPEFFEKFFTQKKEYETNLLKWQCFYPIVEINNKRNEIAHNQETFKNLEEKIECCSAIINKYLEVHPDFEKEYPKLNLDFSEFENKIESEKLDYKKYELEYEEKLKKLNRELELYHTDIKAKLDLHSKQTKPLDLQEKNKKSKKSFFSFFKRNKK